jgi:hypothetical protein
MTDIQLGIDLKTKQPVKISYSDRRTGMYVIGRTGSGKSSLLLQLAVQDMQKGFPFCMIDPHGDLIDGVINNAPPELIENKQIILFAPTMKEEFQDKYPGLNLFSCLDATDPLQVQHTVDQVEQIFTKLFGMSEETPRLAQFIRNITLTAIANPGMGLCEVPELLLNEAYRKRLKGTDTSFWRAYDRLNTRPAEQINWAQSTLNRVDGLINNPMLRPIVGQSKTSINFRQIMDEKKILLVRLDRKLQPLSTLLGGIIISQFLLAALSRGDISEKDRKKEQYHYGLYVDEYQTYSTPDMQSLLTETRKYAVASVVAHQFRKQLDEELRGGTMQVGNLVVFRVIDEDAQELAGEFDLKPPEAMRPAGTVPAHILHRLEHHPDPRIKAFWRKRVVPLDQALKKTERQQTYTDLLGEQHTKTINPIHNFGEGNVSYSLETAQRAYNLLDNMLYAVMEDFDSVTKDDRETLYKAFAPLFKYQQYLDWQTNKTPPRFIVRQASEINERIKPLQEEVTKLNDILTSDDTLVAHLYGSDWDAKPGEIIAYTYTLPEAWERLRAKAAQAPEPATPEQFLAKKRQELERERAEKQGMIDDLNLLQELEISQALDNLEDQKQRYLNFMRDIIDIVKILITDEGRIEVQSTSWQDTPTVQQTYTDRRNQIANELVNMDRLYGPFTARIRTGSGEYMVTTAMDHMKVIDFNKYKWADFKSKRDKIIKYTRELYCTPRTVVEEQIRKRLELPTDPTTRQPKLR